MDQLAPLSKRIYSALLFIFIFYSLFGASGQEDSVYLIKNYTISPVKSILKQQPSSREITLPKESIYQLNILDIKPSKKISLSNNLKKVSSLDTNYVNPSSQWLSPNKSNLDWPVVEEVGNFDVYENAVKSISHLTEKQNLPSDYIWSIEIDSNSHIWMGTYGSGLVKYDGSTTVKYTYENGLVSDFINRVFIDSKGNLWVGTDKGVNRITGDSIATFTEFEGLSDDRVWSFHEDKSGNIWIGTENGLNKISYVKGQPKISIYAIENGLPNNAIWDIEEDRNGNIWVGTSQGLLKMDPAGIGGDSPNESNSFTHYTTQSGLPFDDIWSVEIDKNGNVWMGTNSWGILKLDPAENTVLNITTDQGLPNDWIWDIKEDSEGSIWFATYGEGIVQRDTLGKFYHYSTHNGLSGEFVTSIYEDASRNLWMSTYGGGLNRINSRLGIRNYFTEETGLKDKYVHAIYEDRLGDIWFAFEEGGLAKLHFKDSLKTSYSITDFSDISEFYYNYTWDILQGKNGTFWFATSGGLISLENNSNNKAKITSYTKEAGLPSNDIWIINEDYEGNIWLGTSDKGLAIFSGDSLTVFTKENHLPSDVITDVQVFSDSSIWIGTYEGGFFSLKKEKDSFYSISSFHSKGDPLGNNVTHIAKSEYGNLWVATEGAGMYKVNLQSLEIESLSQQSSSQTQNYVWSIIEDDLGNIWAGTENELMIFPFNSENNLSEFITLTATDGLKSSDFYAGGVLKDRDGLLWWCTGLGPMVLDPNDFFFDPSLPKAGLQTLEIFRETIDYRKLKYDNSYSTAFPFGEALKNSYSRITGNHNYPEDLELPHTIDDINFIMSATHWSSSSDLKFQYQLQGLDEDWSKISNENTASYTNLPFGEYTFRFRALSKFGVWSETETYNFRIKPPLWLNWWAICLEILFGILIFIGIIRFRTYRLLAYKKELELKVKERTKELEESKSQLEDSLKETLETQKRLIKAEKLASIGLISSGIAHELNNPTSAIINGVKTLEMDMQDLLKSVELNPDLKEIVESIQINLNVLELGSNQTSVIIKSLKNYARMDNEVMVEGDVHQALDSTLILLDNKLKYSFEVNKNYDPSIPLIPCYYGQLSQVFMNVFSNAIDAVESSHNREKGRINIETKKEKTHIEISIKDNGCGISEKEKIKIFEPFYTSKELGKGTGIGLSISKSIIEKHRGEIFVNSEPGKGTEFVIRLPI